MKKKLTKLNGIVPKMKNTVGVTKIKMQKNGRKMFIFWFFLNDLM